MAIGRKRVLWVDDEIEFLRSHIMFLETRGYSVIPVFTGDDAIHVLRQSPRDFDIVLLDEQMPGKDGLTTLEEIKQMLPELPVVMVTKSEEERVMEDALGKKIDGYLTKPVNPSQILMVCKRLLDSRQIISSQLAQKFIRSFSQTRADLANAPDAKGWIALHENLTKWDLELAQIEDEGIRQTHAGQRSDANAGFSAFIADSYPEWMKARGNAPLLSPGVVESHVWPRLRDGAKVRFIVLDCMRLDQYLAIEEYLRKYFAVERHYFYSVLPSSGLFARSSLLSGMYPRELAGHYPDVFSQLTEESGHDALHDSKLLGERLRGLGASIPDEPCCSRIADSDDAQKLLKSLPSSASGQFAAVVVDFMRILTQSGSASAVLREIAPDEGAFRSLTKSWFQFSVLFQILREWAQQGCTVVLTAAHGSILCSRSVDLYGSRKMVENLRYQCGVKISCDERYAVVLPDPVFFNLPECGGHGVYVIARENYYFSHPGKFENYQQQYRTSFQFGGISLEEMIVPLAVLTPLNG